MFGLELPLGAVDSGAGVSLSARHIVFGQKGTEKVKCLELGRREANRPMKFDEQVIDYWRCHWNTRYAKAPCDDEGALRQVARTVNWKTDSLDFLTKREQNRGKLTNIWSIFCWVSSFSNRPRMPKSIVAY